MNQQPKRNRRLSPLLDAYARAYAKQNTQSGLLNLTDALKQADQHKEDNWVAWTHQKLFGTSVIEGSITEPIPNT